MFILQQNDKCYLTKHKDVPVSKQGSVNYSEENSVSLMGGGGRLFETGHLLTFSAFRMGAYSRWVLIRGWACI